MVVTLYRKLMLHSTTAVVTRLRTAEQLSNAGSVFVKPFFIAHLASLTAMLASERALANASVLQNIFSYAGLGCWLFIPPVSKLWKLLYKASHRCEDELYIGIHLTAYEAVFQSPSCVQLACEHGLQAMFATTLLQERAGLTMDVPTLIAAQELGLQVTNTCMNSAAVGGHLAVLQLLHGQGVELPAELSNSAAASASMNVLRWLRQIGVAFNAGTARCAAAGGHVKVLQYLHEEACPWDALTCRAAAFNGHLEALQFLHANGCPWADDITCNAASSGSCL